MNRFQPRNNKQQKSENPQLPFDFNVGIYSRQSTQAQLIKNVQSTEMQTTDLIQLAKRIGWKEDQIILYTENVRQDGTFKSASGSLRIDQREGLRALTERIEKDEIKAVIVFQVDRLFRDETQIQVNTFIDLCKRHDCLVRTPDTTFDFHNPMYVKMFRFLAEMAAEYITYHVKGRLHAAKDRLARKGFYTGGCVPIGYIIDRQESSPTYKRYIIYEPHAVIVRWLFRRYCELGGMIGQLCRELQNMPCIFPDFEDPSIAGARTLKKVPGGYHLTREGLIALLSNPVYIGWWIFQGEIHSKTNHAAIVDEQLFWYAFNRLSEYHPNGKKVERTKRSVRYQQHKSLEQGGLLKDVICSSVGKVYTKAHSRDNDQYVIVSTQPHTTHRGYVSIDIRYIDTVFEEKLFAHLRETHTFDHYREFQDKQQSENASILKSINDQLRQVAISEDHILDNLSQTSNKELHGKLEERFAKLQTQKQELLARKSELEAQEDTTSPIALLAEFHTELEKLIPVWQEKPLRDRRLLVNALVRQAILDEMAPHWLRLTIIWVHPEWGEETFYVYRQNGGKSKPWTEEENALLRTHYPTTDRDTILTLFPTRSWFSINNQAADLGVKREKRTMEKPSIPNGLALSDWQFMQEHGIDYAQIAIANRDITCSPV